MFGTNWHDPQTLWLNLTNLTLALVTVAAVLVVIVGLARDFALRRRKARELDGLDAEMNAMLNSSHILNVPELGLTMADGGEPLPPASGETSGDRPRS